MADRDLYKLIDDLDMQEDNQEVEYVDDWYCMECDYGPMNEEHDKCERCDEPHPTMKKKKTIDEDGWEDEDIASELEEIY